jgi:hypothetical protein
LVTEKTWSGEGNIAAAQFYGWLQYIGLLGCGRIKEIVRGVLQNCHSHTKLVMELKQVINGSRELVLMKVDRQQNRVADCLATHARVGQFSRLWYDCSPRFLSDFVACDFNPIIE